MQIIILSILIIVIGVIVIANIKIKNDQAQGALGIISKAACLCIDIITHLENRIAQSGRIRLRSGREKVRDNLRILNVTGNIDDVYIMYRIEKLRIIIIILLVGLALINLMYVMKDDTSILINGDRIARNTAGGGRRSVDLDAVVGDYRYSKRIDVNECSYDNDEVSIVFDKVMKMLEEIILGNNISVDNIRHDMNLVNRVEGCSIDISWDTSDYILIDNYGSVNNENVGEEGELVTLTAKLKYGEEVEYAEYHIRILPSILNDSEVLAKELEDRIYELDISSSNYDYQQLPNEINGNSIIWKESKDKSNYMLFILLILTVFGVAKSKDMDISKRVSRREESLKIYYPNLIGKLALYLGAGLSVRGAFNKICRDYQASRERGGKAICVLEEVSIICNKMNTGVSELVAYEYLASRCKLSSYKKLATILTQNIQKGSAGMLKAIKAEAMEAFEERKVIARRRGEEAGTKLLLPMVIMMGIVMILIMIPAYTSFSG